MNLISKKIVSLNAFAICAFTLTACSGGSSSSQFLKNVSLNVSTQGTETDLNLVSTFDLGGNVSLAEMSVAVIDPKTGANRGAVDFSQLANGTGQITLTANTALIPNSDAALGQVMPNGKPLPLSLGVQPGQVLGVQILDHSIVYLGGDTSKVAYAGVALGIKGFDQVMSQLATAANVFFMANFGTTVMGVGGIYGSATPYESGIAIFGRYTHPAAATPELLKSQANLQQMHDASDYEIQKLNYATYRRLKKFFSKKKTLEFY